jgi:DNA repair protein RadA/Sms
MPKWMGKCPECQAWGSIEEVASEATASVGLKSSLKGGTVTTSARRIREIDATKAKHSPTGIGELDRVLGGGFIQGGAILLAGEPGVGKSTLLLDVANRAAKSGRTVLYATGEESAEQIKHRAVRMDVDADELYIASETDLSVILGHVEEVAPDLLIVDSVQTIASPHVDGRIGGVSQVTEVASALTRTCKARGIPMILVGQVTKDGNIAGPKVVEHLVDVVLHFEGDKHSTLRMLRGVKNRYGAADEVGCFTMTGAGIEEIADPSGLFLGQRDEPVAGTCVTVVVEGKRPLPAEVQALVAQSHLPQPRRGASGLDNARLAMTQAVIERHGSVRLFDKDVFCATVGGMKIAEPSADLALALAIASAAADAPLSADVIALGEVALSGDIRPVPDIERRLAEAGRLGFRKALVPNGTKEKLGGRSVGITLIEVGTVQRAVAAIAAMQPRD